MLSVKNLNVEIAGALILRGVTFDLKAGRTTVLIGRNGAGKTTTLRAIMGLQPKREGELRLADTDLGAVPGYARAGLGIGYAPEDRRLIPAFTVEENILLPAYAINMNRQERQRRLEEVYELLPQLRVMASRPGGGVSGGQGKMVALGRAMMTATRVLLLDEPFQGLAPALALEYAQALKRLRAAHPDVAFLITESSPELLAAIADESLQIERGMIETAQTQPA
ncbi:ABC transporter ATP-binding protein [Pseudohoeflea coraliihabitans]|uniref:ATP-binding cassette domain-containing protein n=1 Tax=Pseudohoeflea coraliihabitans TaxID=2860393 RepID=A0ABS6WQG4_9HYPH|nr:ATP-binding cassette domain-containing protein [Pseudohoeflea sp. DP4N28-3]MBW3098155.1 ATP-binding cassette domain-containing protein [Pseudohoeflea sp. DP4N28-3]